MALTSSHGHSTSSSKWSSAAAENVRNLRLACSGGGIMHPTISNANYTETRELLVTRHQVTGERLQTAMRFVDRAANGQVTNNTAPRFPFCLIVLDLLFSNK